MILELLVRPATRFLGADLSWGDLLGFATGLWCVWLTVRASIWNFPTGIVNSVILGLVFLQQRLFSDASLQLVFIALGFQGWWMWVRGSGKTELAVTRSPFREQAIASGVTLLGWAALWVLMVRLKGAMPPVDAGITAASLAAQWLLNRKRLENWWWWIAVDVVSVPLYWSRGLLLISLLYAVFLVLCVAGWLRWRREVVA